MNSLVLGLSLGLAAGVSPGPLLVLVITSTLRSGLRAGVFTACAPLISDVVIVTATFLVLDQLSERVLGVVGVAGAAFVIWTGVATIREARGATLRPAGEAVRRSALLDLRRAVVVNFLSPHPWVMWATVMGPLAITAWQDAPAGGVAIVAGFYVTIVGAKVAVAALVAGGRRRLSDRGYRRALYGAGALLVLAGIALGMEFAPTIW